MRALEQKPRPDEITMKEWRMQTASDLKVAESTVSKWIKAGKIQMPERRKINSKLVFVKCGNTCTGN